jgi:hypothetical protein
MARFSLQPSQQSPRSVFVPLDRLQDLLDLDGSVNLVALAVDADRAGAGVALSDLAEVKKSLQPRLEDFGLKVDVLAVGGKSGSSYARMSGDRLVLPPALVDVATERFGSRGLQPVITYLANAIIAGDRRIPYSTVAGVDSTKELGPVVDDGGNPIQLADNEIALNDWAARDLGVERGDEIEITYPRPAARGAAAEI